MKFIKFGVLMMMVLGVLAGCASKDPSTSTGDFIHFIDVYLNEDLKYVTLENDKEIGQLLIFPGDYLYINNLTKDKVVIHLAPDVFETEELEVTLEGNKRIRLKVLKEATVAGTFKTAKDDNIIDSNPKVKVGDGP